MVGSLFSRDTLLVGFYDMSLRSYSNSLLNPGRSTSRRRNEKKEGTDATRGCQSRSSSPPSSNSHHSVAPSLDLFTKPFILAMTSSTSFTSLAVTALIVPPALYLLWKVTSPLPSSSSEPTSSDPSSSSSSSKSKKKKTAAKKAILTPPTPSALSEPTPPTPKTPKKKASASKKDAASSSSSSPPPPAPVAAPEPERAVDEKKKKTKKPDAEVQFDKQAKKAGKTGVEE